MKKLSANEIREKYLTFFESKGHLRMESFSLIPNNDKSLLLINSGMAPLKPYFTGKETPPSKRVTTCQKCIRTGDIDNAGRTARHGTFFEMLGNFSFGDYFKEEIIAWAWEFVTKELELPVENLYVSIYEEDDESFKIWNENIGLSPDRIVRLGKDDNFWEVGIGPCGPCSEIYYDRGEAFGCGKDTCFVGCDCDRYLEFWNLVFTQFDKTEQGTYEKLKNPNIDTGMGLERMAAIMQGVDSIFDIDTFVAIRNKVSELSGVTYKSDAIKDISIRVISDHVRSVTHLIADGVLPSNEGRGYVLRRLLRRSLRHARLLGIKKAFLSDLVDIVIEGSKDAYTNLSEKEEFIQKIVGVEEEKFSALIDSGMSLLREIIDKVKNKSEKILKGEDAFKLYDTYGFPIDLTNEILQEENLSYDETAFKEELDKQRKRAREAREDNTFMGARETIFDSLNPTEKTIFTGYEKLKETSPIIAIAKSDSFIDEVLETDDTYMIVTEKTCFYAEGGGQIGDNGIIETATGKFEVHNTVKLGRNKHVHIGKLMEGTINKNDIATLKVDTVNRALTTRNHTATHLLQKALREVVGNHVEQAGSYVTPERLRFDFTNFEPLGQDKIKHIEQIINEKILECLPVSITNMPIELAKEIGAMALFGEKYDNIVRVVMVSDFSVELCGGCHVFNTSDIGMFKIISETGIASGVRRIEAATSMSLMPIIENYEHLLKEVMTQLKTTPENLLVRVQGVLTEQKELQREMDKLKSKMSLSALDDILKDAKEINGTYVVTAKIESMSTDDLRNLSDKIKDKCKSCAIVLASNEGGKVNIISAVSDNLVKNGIHAGNIIKEVATICGGGGGGRPNMAQAGGKNPEKIDEALKQASEIILEKM